MPRRLPVRPAKVFGNLFVLIVLVLILFIYYVTMFIVFGPKAKRKYFLNGLWIIRSELIYFFTIV